MLCQHGMFASSACKISEMIVDKIIYDLNQSIFFDFPDFFLKVLYEMKLEVEKNKGLPIEIDNKAKVFEMELLDG